MASPSFDDICERLEIPENLRKHVAEATPARAKMAVARGLLPVPPKTLLAMQYMLLGDASAEIASETQKSLLNMPEDRLVPLLDRKTHPKLLEFLAYKRPDHHHLAETIALAHQINDKTLCYLAEAGSTRVCEIVAGNHERLIITPQVRLFLQRNENSTKALVDRVKSFQRLYGIELPELQAAEVQSDEPDADLAPDPAVAPPPAPPKRDDEEGGSPHASDSGPPTEVVTVAAPGPVWSIPPKAIDTPTVPPIPANDVADGPLIPPAPSEAYETPTGLLNPIEGLLADWGLSAEANYLAPPEAANLSNAGGQGPIAAPAIAITRPDSAADVDLGGAEELTGHGQEATALSLDLSGGRSLVGSDFTFNFEEEEASFDDEFVDPDQEDDDAIRISLQRRLSTMSMADKIKLAYKGNKSARDILVRDPNKIVGVAVVKSGRITETEVMAIATNRSINEEVIRALTENREYLRKYPVKLALANNPKTPIPTAIGLLNSLHVNDLKKLANNRNVGSAVFMRANKLYKSRKAGQS